MCAHPLAFPLDPGLLPDFPVRHFLPQIRSSLEKDGLLILGATTGAGKSTLVPPALRGLPFLGDKRILVLQPQRLSTWAIASRIGKLCGLDFGPELGLITSSGRQGSPNARIQVMTSGVFLRRIQDDPSLDDVGCVIFDEFHQRSWQADLALSFCLDSRELFNPDLRLLVMSATLDAQALKNLLPGAASLEVPGTLHPVSQEWLAPPPEASWWKNRREFLQWSARQIRREWEGLSADGAASPGTPASHAGGPRPGTGGNLLCFLPGLGEIRSVHQALDTLGLPEGTVIHELHSSTPDAAQARALDAPERGQIFLASSIAETGLTLKGVVLVMDSGLSRLEFFDPRLGMNSLQTSRVSLDSSLQRQGRSGRTGPGRCLKLWPREEILDTRRLPDIQRSDLSSFALEAALWGARDSGDLHLVDPPARSLWNSAVTGLSETGILMATKDVDTRASTPPAQADEWLALPQPSTLAREVSALGLHPRLAQAVLKAKVLGRKEAAFVLALASFLEYRGSHPPAHIPGSGGSPAGTGPSGTSGSGSGNRTPNSHHVPSGSDILPALDQLFSRFGSTEIHEHYRKTGARLWGIPPGEVLLPPASHEVDHTFLCQSIQPLWTGQLLGREGTKATYLLAQGRQATLNLDPNHAAPKWIAGLELETGSSSSTIRLYAPLDERWYQAFLKTCREQIVVTWEGLSWKATAQRGFGALTFTETPISLSSTERRQALETAVQDAFTTMLARQGLDLLPWNEASLQLYWRLARALDQGIITLKTGSGGTETGQDVPAAGRFFSPRLNTLLGSSGAAHLQVKQGQPVLDEHRLLDMLGNLLSWKDRETLDLKVPATWAPPGKRPARIDWSGSPSGLAPSVELRIKDAFGIRVHPLFLGQALVFHLLSPAGRPVQVTADLPGFWTGSWKEVRKDLKGRYPKHEWPENPLNT